MRRQQCCTLYSMHCIMYNWTMYIVQYTEHLFFSFSGGPVSPLIGFNSILTRGFKLHKALIPKERKKPCRQSIDAMLIFSRPCFCFLQPTRLRRRSTKFRSGFKIFSSSKPKLSQDLAKMMKILSWSQERSCSAAGPFPPSPSSSQLPTNSSRWRSFPEGTEVSSTSSSS